MAFYNEVAVSVYLYVAFLLSDYLETQINDNQALVDSFRLVFAWILTSLLIFTIFANLLHFLIDMAIAGFKYLKNKCK